MTGNPSSEKCDEPERYEEWTPCEMYGHKYEDGRCVDCGEKEDA